MAAGGETTEERGSEPLNTSHLGPWWRERELVLLARGHSGAEQDSGRVACVDEEDAERTLSDCVWLLSPVLGKCSDVRSPMCGSITPVSQRLR